MSMSAPTAIDLFSGIGGSTEGAEQAGYRVLWAGNHSKLACHWHHANHPKVIHACQDLHLVNWEEVPRAQVVLASSSCKGSTRARGKEKKHHDAERATAWAIIDCMECHQPDVVVFENVPEFEQWLLFPAFRLAWERTGYRWSPHILDAADFGVPQHRVRLVGIGTRSKAPLVLQLPRRKHVPFSRVMDRTGNWSLVNKPGRASATIARVKAGRAAFGPRFVMPYYGSGSGLTGRSLDRPLGTVTCVDRWAVVDGNRMRMCSKQEYLRAMSFPESYRLPDCKRDAVHLMGNAVPPVMEREILKALRRAA